MAYRIVNGKLVKENNFPRGQLHRGDEGQVEMAVFADPARGVVVLDFPKKVHWMALEPDKVDELIKLLQENKAKLG